MIQDYGEYFIHLFAYMLSVLCNYWDRNCLQIPGFDSCDDNLFYQIWTFENPKLLDACKTCSISHSFHINYVWYMSNRLCFNYKMYGIVIQQLSFVKPI
jgi:hypothetical protein